MNLSDWGRRPGVVLAGALAIVVWGAAGYYQGINSGFSGGLYDPEYRVPGVLPGSMAEKAGLKVGDRIVSVEGRPVEELGMESRWPRSLAPRIGQSHRFVVERKGERVSLDVVYDGPSPAVVKGRLGALLAQWAFLAAGVWAFLTVGTPASALLARIGFAAGVAGSFGLGPSLGVWNGVKGHIATAASALVFLLLLRFFLTFPAAKRVSRSRIAVWILYGCWGCLLAFLLVEMIVHPALYYTTGSVAFPLMMAYAMLALGAIVHTVVTTPGAELHKSGMSLVLAGLLATVAALAVALFLPVRVPAWVYSLLIAPVPFVMAMAVWKQARRAAPTAL